MEPVQEKPVAVEFDQVTAERINEPKFTASLVRVVEYVCGNRSRGGEALARLLMSCYNGGEYPIDLSELCRVDDEFFEDAMNVIRLRCRSNQEPHCFFVNGGRLFNQIAADYRIEGKSDLSDEGLLS